MDKQSALFMGGAVVASWIFYLINPTENQLGGAIILTAAVLGFFINEAIKDK